MRERNIEIFNETEEIIEKGYYILPGQRRVNLKLNKEQLKETVVITNNYAKEILKNRNILEPSSTERCSFEVVEIDSYAAAINLHKKNAEKILVLNFANPVHPGGGVTRGAKAQEEDLCRKSTLFASLMSNSAKEMYEYNIKNSSILSSHYMLLSPYVEIIRDEYNFLLEDTVIVSVLTAAAPYLSRGAGNIPMKRIEEVFFDRIEALLRIAAKNGYFNLVLGAWGCGAFGNDAMMVAKLFFDAFQKDNMKGYFSKVVFAILKNHGETYNYDCFKKYFPSI